MGTACTPVSYAPMREKARGAIHMRGWEVTDGRTDTGNMNWDMQLDTHLVTLSHRESYRIIHSWRAKPHYILRDIRVLDVDFLRDPSW